MKIENVPIPVSEEKFSPRLKFWRQHKGAPYNCHSCVCVIRGGGGAGGRQNRNGITVLCGAGRERGQVRTRCPRCGPITGEDPGLATNQSEASTWNHAAALDTQWEQSLSSPVKSLLTKCQIKYCYKHFINRSFESIYSIQFLLLHSVQVLPASGGFLKCVWNCLVGWQWLAVGGQLANCVCLESWAGPGWYVV